MSKDLAKKAVEMLLKGATLVSDPCPYCKGVRVIKDGHALCVNCGREAKDENIPVQIEEKKPDVNIALTKFEQKLQDLAKELEQEKDHEKQQKILKSISELTDIIDKLKKIR
ncbi:MAG: Sjogren's syndrome/scleroderma autoantigen 1 family protein [Nitrosopumilaceae archaeon]